MTGKRQIILLLAAVLAGQSSVAQSGKAATDIARDLFRSHDIVATFAVASADGQVESVYNPERAAERFAAASTFKIPNTLIALDAGVVTSRDSTFTWDGRDRGLPFWNRDHTLASAIRFSCVWCYQEMARQVGREKYAEELARMDYGNQFLGDTPDRFWLNGDLKISALEQIRFLRKLFNDELPYRREHVDLLKEIMLVEEGEGYRIHAKTGWTGAAVTPQVGWYVGFMEAGAKTWLFAMNMQVDREADLPLRIEITKEALQTLLPER
jgi:beta-lactamase class D